MEKSDLLIVGGGASGCSAAYNAAKSGLKVILVEKNNFLGGLMTGGLVIPAMKTDHENINTDFFEDLISTAKKYGGQIEYFDKNRAWFNPEILKIVLDQMLFKNNVKILFEAQPYKVISNKNLIDYIEISGKTLSLSIKSKYYLDSSGDSIIFKLLGEKFLEENIEKQPSSLRFIMSGVNIQELEKFLLGIDSNRDVTNSCNVNGEIHLTSAYTWDSDKWNLKPVFDNAVKDGVLKDSDRAYFQIFTIAGAQGSIAFNCPRLRNFNKNSIFDESCALIEAREVIFRLSQFAKKYIKGFENAYISNIASMTGTRESNKILPEKEFTHQDLISEYKPDKPILAGDYPIDIHSNSKGKSTLKKMNKYYLNILALKSKNYKNLFAAGRNLGADKYAHSALRTQISCMSMGEGVAKYIASQIK